MDKPCSPATHHADDRLLRDARKVAAQLDHLGYYPPHCNAEEMASMLRALIARVTPSATRSIPRYHCYLGQENAEFPLDGGWQMKRSEQGAWVRYEDVRDFIPSASTSIWQTIETAPKDKMILLWGRYWSDEQGWFKEPLFGMWSERGQRWECGWMCWFGVRPTHWMPIPAAPDRNDA